MSDFAVDRDVFDLRPYAEMMDWMDFVGARIVIYRGLELRPRRFYRRRHKRMAGK